MELTIDLETGVGRVKEYLGHTDRHGNRLPHSTGFVAGDTEFANKHGFAAIADVAWTDEMKTGFLTKQAEEKANAEAEAKAEAKRRDEAEAARVQAKLDEEAAFETRVKAEVAKQLAAQEA